MESDGLKQKHEARGRSDRSMRPRLAGFGAVRSFVASFKGKRLSLYLGEARLRYGYYSK
jgi:hypothetical protein